MHRKFLSFSLIASLLAGCTQMKSLTSQSDKPQHATITVSLDKPGARINPAMWGIFFEDINFGADGGLYAEMVKNRSFEFPESLMGWTPIISNVAKGEITTRDDAPFRETNPHYLRIVSRAEPPIAVSNEGFRGMGVVAGDAYDFSAQIRVVEGSPRVTLSIVSSDGLTLVSTRLAGMSANWSKVAATIKPKETDPKARLVITVEGRGAVDFDMVSLFPQKTWKNRPGGLRADMVQMLADLKPGFFRFPGGCIVEGSDLSKRYQWKNTIGPIEDRKLLFNRWNNEFPHKPTPDYYQSFGLGFFEYFQLCEDIGAQPLPIINCGMACQFNSGELCPIDELGPYVQDALDLIEFANGPATSTWGAKRAAMGHPQPFNMKMMGVGNEQWGQQYLDRLAVFTKAIKEKHPEITLVSDAGPSPSDERFDFLWPQLQKMNAEMVDQHCYANPIWFLSNSTRYDNYDRNGPKVFFGEYAAQSVAIVSPRNRNNFECALSEAAYMTGLERNADVVRMASYAPLFANVDAWQWTPNLIWTDSLRIKGTPNYYVQQLFSTNRGDVIIPATNDAPVREILPAGRIGIHAPGGTAEISDVKVTQGSNAPTTLFDPTFTATSARRTGGDVKWDNYTVTLRARKTAGSDGFVVTVLDDGAGAWAQWILGGWGNKQHGILTHYAEQDQLLERVPGTIESNRWYDVKIVIQGSKMECYLDGKLIQSAEVLHHRVPGLFTSATKDEKTGETILKVVNPGTAPAATTIKLQGANNIASTAKALVMTANLADENSFEKPNAVVPQATTISGVKSEFSYTFKPHSVNVIRLGTEK